MSRSIHSSRVLMGILLLAAALLLTACSDSDGPASPVIEPLNTPDIPIANNPQEQLPNTSEFLTDESAVLKNLSPDLVGATTVMLEELNETHAIDFRLPAGRNTLFADGQACFPENLQWSFNGYWYDMLPTTSEDPFSYLGVYGNSHYYLCEAPIRWYFADANCRNFGGHLVSLTSADESDFVVAAVNAVSPNLLFHIGLTDWSLANGSWIWTSGEPYQWSNWAPGEPNNYNGEYFIHTHTTGQSTS